VAWPPKEDGDFRHLISPFELAGTEIAAGGGVSKSLVRLAVQRREALMFCESREEDVDVAQSTQIKGIRSAVYVPLLTSTNQILGVFCVDCPLPSLPFDEDSFQFLRAVGGLLAATLEANRLRESARERELEMRNAEARRESLAKFLKIASHDLKNPLTVVRACSHLIREMDDMDTIKKLNSRIIDAEDRAENLIKAYLEVSELESEHSLNLELESIDLKEAVDKEIEFIKSANPSSSFRFVNEMEPVEVQADPQKLSQVLNNLIGNAAKYTPGGGTVTIMAEKAENGFVHASVSDEGVGISEVDQQKLFKEFQRVGDRSLAAGTGLGLWLTNALIQGHGGKVWVESEEGKGSTFFFSLPS
jgi:signal transduction histidine kinase